MSRHTSRHLARRILAAALLLIPYPSGTSWAGDRRSFDDLTRYSLDELLNIEVSSVSRKEQRLSETPAAIFVITQDDIRRSGAHSVPDVLRHVPGLHVAQIAASKWAVSARGFNGRFADKMLVLVDGRSLYTSIFSGTYWDQNDVPLEDIERIEVIRGPGATMWGANAVNGVINIITRSAWQTQGGVVSAAGETDGGTSLLARYGGKAGTKVAYRGYSKVFRSGSGVREDGAESMDHWRAWRAGGRLDMNLSSRDTLTVDGAGYTESAQQGFFASFPLLSGEARPDAVSANGGYGLAKWQRRLSGRSELAVQGYVSRDSRSEGLGNFDSWTGDVEFEHRFQPRRGHDLTWGTGYRYSGVTLRVREWAPVIHFTPPQRGDNLYSTFVQDEISLVEDRLSLTLGTKLQHNGYTGLEVQPNARLAWLPARRLMFWTAASRAVRTPSRKDRDLYMNYTAEAPGGMQVGVRFAGSPDFRSEDLRAYEGGVRIQPAARLAVDLAGFANQYRNLESASMSTPVFQPVAPYLVIPMRFTNDLKAKSHGIEAVATWTVAPSLKLVGGYTWLVIDQDDSKVHLFGQPADPGNQTFGRASWDITPRLFAESTAHYISALEPFGIRGQTRLDATLGFRISPNVDLSAGGTGLLRPRQAEYGVGSDYTASSLVPRAGFLRLTWRF